MQLENLHDSLQPTRLPPTPEIYWNDLAAGMENSPPNYTSNIRGDIFNGGFSHSNEFLPCGVQFYDRPFAPFQPTCFPLTPMENLNLDV